MADVEMRGWVLTTLILAMTTAWAGESELERRVRILEQRISSKALMQMMQQVDQLQREVHALRGQVETLENTLGQLREGQKRQYLDLDRRLRRLEGGGTGAAVEESEQWGEEVPSTPQTPDVVENKPPAPIPSGSPPAPASEQAKKAYRQAYDKLQAGHFDAAIAAFTTFLQQYPSNSLSANAYYWLGEAYYVKRDFNAAQSAFRQVVEHFPTSFKVPDALLKLGYVAYEQRRWQDARDTLNEVVSHYPDTHAARLAAERLARMKQEGRR